MDPRPLTARQLLLMAEGLGRERWSHTSALLWMTAMVNRDPKKRKPRIEDYNPYLRSRRRVPEATEEDLQMLRQALEGREGIHLERMEAD